MEIADYLSDKEKAAIEVLVAGGFRAFTEAKLENVRELDTGLRRRTFRNRGKYQLVLACRSLVDRKTVDPVLETETDIEETELPERKPISPKPVSEMTKADLMAEAKGYEEITGEYGMNKAELATAVQAHRDRRLLIHRKFKE